MGRSFDQWLDRLIEEKGFDLEYCYDRDLGELGFANIDLGAVVSAMKQCSPSEQHKIKNTLVMLDFKNGNMHHYFGHLAEGLGRAQLQQMGYGETPAEVAIQTAAPDRIERILSILRLRDPETETSRDELDDFFTAAELNRIGNDGSYEEAADHFLEQQEESVGEKL